MNINPYHPPHSDRPAEPELRASHDLPPRPFWMTAAYWLCSAALLFCGIVIVASIYEIMRTRSAPPGPFAADFSNSIFGNRSMEREIVEMLVVASPFGVAIWLLRRTRRLREAAGTGKSVF